MYKAVIKNITKGTWLVDDADGSCVCTRIRGEATEFVDEADAWATLTKLNDGQEDCFTLIVVQREPNTYWAFGGMVDGYGIRCSDGRILIEQNVFNGLGRDKINQEIVDALNDHARLQQSNAALLEALTKIVKLKMESGMSRPYIDTILTIAKDAIENAAE